MSGESLLLPPAKQFYESIRGHPHISTLTPAEVRELWRAETPKLTVPDNVAEVYDTSALGPAGKVPLRIYEPKGPGPFPICVYFHGGGFVGGSLYSHARRAVHIASIIGAVTVAVEYRLAPEHPYPAAVEDCWAAAIWAEANAEQIKGDANRLFVFGESAGGNLAAVISLLGKERGKNGFIKAQICVSPVVDAANLSRPSYSEFKDDEFEDKAAMEWFFEQYFGAIGKDPHDPHISPIYADNLFGLPPAFILSAEVDILRDEAEAYAEKLLSAGVDVKLLRCKGHFHNSMIDVEMFGDTAKDTYRQVKFFLDRVL